MEEIVIIGAGVAGLSCLNALLDQNISALLIEASTIGTPKMCGEFIAPYAKNKLQQWGIGLIQCVKHVDFFTGVKPLRVVLNRHAGAYSRGAAECDLAARARQLGGRIMEQSPIKHITPATQSTPHLLHLVSGEVIQARNLIMATGKFSQTHVPHKASAYVGFKTHIAQVIQPETLLMHSLQGGYLGIVPISSATSNLTCLVRREQIKPTTTCRAYLHQLINTNRSLQKNLDILDIDTNDWLEGDAPTFGLKNYPNWPHTYWIGDAHASVHPSIGYGFAHAVNSAVMAVEYYLAGDVVGYHQAIKRQLRPKRLIGQCIHFALQKPSVCRVISRVFEKNISVRSQLLKTLDY